MSYFSDISNNGFPAKTTAYFN